MFDATQDSDDPTSFRQSILGAFDSLIGTLEAAQPLRLDGERRDFLKVKTDDDLMIVRAELVAGAKLARAGVGFDFGARGGKPEPDLLLRDAHLAIEVKARRLNGLQDLHDELEAALEEIAAPVMVYLACDERPLYLKPDKRASMVKETLDRVRSGAWGTAVTELDQPWATTPLLPISVRIFQQPPAPGSSRVVIEGGWELSGHLQDVESEVLAVLRDEQKVNQAEAMPTVLLVDAARTGMAWIRPPHIWARSLADQLPDDTPFIGVGVMIPTLDSPDASISLALRANVPAEDMAAAHRLAQDLGLTEI
jgi:hypothetical protein